MDKSRLADEVTFKNVVNVQIISSDANYTTVTTSLTSELAQINKQLADVKKKLADVKGLLAETKADANADLNAYTDELRAWQKQSEGVFRELMEPGADFPGKSGKGVCRKFISRRCVDGNYVVLGSARIRNIVWPGPSRRRVFV